MKPMRKVISSRHVIAFVLNCGHTVYRAPLSDKAVIPLRMGCTECERITYQTFDTEQAIARARRELLEQLPEEVRNLLDVSPDKSSNAARDAAKED